MEKYVRVPVLVSFLVLVLVRVLIVVHVLETIFMHSPGRRPGQFLPPVSLFRLAVSISKKKKSQKGWDWLAGQWPWLFGLSPFGGIGGFNSPGFGFSVYGTISLVTLFSFSGF